MTPKRTRAERVRSSERPGSRGPRPALGPGVEFRAALQASELLNERGASPEVLPALTPHLCQAFHACGWGVLLSRNPVPEFRVFLEQELTEPEMSAICTQAMGLYSEFAESGEERSYPGPVPAPAPSPAEGARILLAWQMLVPRGFLGLAFLLSEGEATPSLQEVRLFSLLANQLAAAVENARLHDQLRSEASGAPEAEQDPATRLPRRAYFQRELGYEIKRSRRYGQPLACALVDFSALRAAGRRSGPAFDQEVRQLAQRLRASSREVDLAARFAGNQFALVLPNTTAAGARSLARRFLKSLPRGAGAGPGTAGGRGAPGAVVRVCVGQVRRKGDTPQSVLARLQGRLKQARSRARGGPLVTAPARGQ